MALFLVTGGCGFIGSHLADALIARGDRVRILDNLSTGRRENMPPSAELTVGDIKDLATVRKCIDGVDGVFHLAAIASVDQARRDWLGCHAVNLTGAINVFEAARSRAARVVYASSAAIYGDNEATPLSEGHVPQPINAYGADKLGCELHGRVATLMHGVPTVGLRLFNVFGPRQDPHSPYSGVISIFFDRLRQNRPIEIFGDGSNVRDFIAVADVVEFFIAAMSASGAAGEVFNVCTGHGTTILGLVDAIAAVLGVRPELRFGPPRPGDIQVSIGDPTRAVRGLGRKARFSLHEGLARLSGTVGVPAE